MYEQDLVEIIEPVKKTTISRLNKGKKWKYGYDKEHDIIVISKTGQIGEVLEIQNLRIALPIVPKGVYKHKEEKWVKFEIPKQLSKLKNIFDQYKPHYVINCAAESHVDRSIENSKDFINSNQFCNRWTYLNHFR